MANNEIRNEFFHFLYQFINFEVAQELKDVLLENSKYKYALDNFERIEFLEAQKRGDILPSWNPFSIKGVKYENGNCEIVKSEIDDLVIEYGVNLSNKDFGLFENELDQYKPDGLKSSSLLISAVDDCLRTQVINEMIRELKFSESIEIFKDPPSKEFFEYLFYEFIIKDTYPKTAVQYVFRQFFDTGYNPNKIEMDYSIKKGHVEKFAEYYNSFIIDKVPKEKLKDFQIKIILNDPKIKPLDDIGNKDIRKEVFNSLLLKFIEGNKTVE